MRLDDITKAIGTRVRAGRKRSGVTRKQLSARAGVSERYLNELENGEANASVGVLVKIADALDLSFEALVADCGTTRADRDCRGNTHEEMHRLITSMSLAEQDLAMPILAQFLSDRRRASKGIALLGLRGAGKSTLGRLLAERHNLPFVSVTREIEGKAGMSVSDLFNLAGADAYRALENEVVTELARRPDRVLLETAGGIVGNSVALDTIFDAFTTVWLKASPEEHLARVAGQGDMRPMRGNPKALEHLKALLAQRAPDYARAAHVIDTSGRDVSSCLADLDRIAGPILAAS